jgi:hypothetical protein
MFVAKAQGCPVQQNVFHLTYALIAAALASDLFSLLSLSLSAASLDNLSFSLSLAGLALSLLALAIASSDLNNNYFFPTFHARPGPTGRRITRTVIFWNHAPQAHVQDNLKRYLMA